MVALEHRGAQAERLRRDAADPKLHALNLDLDEDRTPAVCFGRKVDVISGLPTAAGLELVLAKSGSASQDDVGEIWLVLKEDRDGAVAPDVSRLVRPAVGEEPDLPFVLARVVQNFAPWAAREARRTPAALASNSARNFASSSPRQR